MACTTAVREADRGKRTLIVTTDPASNLADVFEQSIGHKITPIAGVPNLWAMEIDPDQATQEYIDRAMAPIREAFPEQIVPVMEEQMSGPCTAEVAAFDRFVDFLDLWRAARRAGARRRFDTGNLRYRAHRPHLRLLELPAEWSRSIDEASAGSGQTCIGPAAAIQDAKHKYERALATMRDPEQTTLHLRAPAGGHLNQGDARAIGELGKLGIHTHQLIVNGIPADPNNSGSYVFSSAGANSYARLYHSVALLLPDATVWLAGGNPKRGGYVQQMEIYQPPYLFDSTGALAARPSITGAPSAISYGNAFSVQTPDAATINRVVLVRNGTVTHAFGMDQREVELAFTVQSGSLAVTAPPNGNIAPPGYYMLFLLNNSGVPSVAKFVQVTSQQRTSQ